MELLSPAGEELVPLPIGETRPTDRFDEIRLAIYEAVPRRRYRSPGEIALDADVSLPRCLAELAALDEAGMIEAGPGGWRLR